MKSKKNYLFIFLISAFGCIGFSALAQSSKTLELKSVAVKSKPGTNAKIKADIPKSDAQPVAKIRGGCGCNYKLVNHTDLYIKVYIEGYYKGTLGPWSEAKITIIDRYSKIYMVSVGGTKEWYYNSDGKDIETFIIK